MARWIGWSRRAPLIFLGGFLSLASAGCVDRLLQIRSEPPGATVYLNGERAGKTPLDHRFDYYGTFDVTLRAEGRASVHRLEPVRAPWYGYFPFDFVAENLLPFRIRDHRELRYELEEARPLEGKEVDREVGAILERARALEARAAAPPREKK